MSAFTTNLQGVSWYHGRVDRQTAENLLAGRRPGSYFVRDSSTCYGDFVLSVSENNKVSHYIISRRQNCYLIGDQSFQDLPAVIEFYKKHFLDTTTLVEAVAQPQPPSQPPSHPQSHPQPHPQAPPQPYPQAPPQPYPQVPAQQLQPISPQHAPVEPLPPPVNVVGKLIVVGKFDFNSEDPEDLCFKKGDQMTVVRKDEDEWWFAKHEDGRSGSIPVPYIIIKTES